MGKVKIHKFKIIVEEKNKFLTARVEEIPSLQAHGKNIDELMRKLENAIVTHLEKNRFAGTVSNSSDIFPTFNHIEAKA